MRILQGVFLSLVFLSSCSLDGNDKDVIVTVDTNYTVAIAEDLMSPGGFQFRVETVEDRPCLNSIINLDFDVIGNELTLWVNEVEEPENCDEGTAPAMGTVGSGFTPNGTYSFKVIVANTFENHGTLEVSPESYQVEMETTDGINFKTSNFLKIPNEIMWGYFAFNEEEVDGEDIQSYLDELRALNELTNLPSLSYFICNRL